MAEHSSISWTDHTFNPWWGCERVSPACANCYADTLALRYGHDLWGDEHGFRFFGDKHWAEPLRWEKRAARSGVRARVFCASMADVFEERGELKGHRYRLFDLIEETPSLDWLILTKRPEYARDWFADHGFASALPPNVWMGVSIENQAFTWRADVLREIAAKIRFLSCEPLLRPLLGGVERSAPRLGPGRAPLDLDGIDWVIVGGESGGRDARPMHPDWARELRDECLRRSIAFHFKQWGSWTPDLIGRYDEARFVLPTGMTVELALGVPAAARMGYAGASSKSGGKLLDGVEWCEIPETAVYA